MAAQQASLLYRIFAHVMVFGLCVAMPAVVMLIMPVATTTFIRQDGKVSATVVRKVFFVIPFRTETIPDVVGVDDQYQAGTLSKTTRSGPVNDPMRPVTRTEDMGWLVIQGKGESVEVPVSPADMDHKRRAARDFLEDPAMPELKLFTVANWKISVVTGGILCLLTLAYVGSLLWSIFSLLFRRSGR